MTDDVNELKDHVMVIFKCGNEDAAQTVRKTLAYCDDKGIALHIGGSVAMPVTWHVNSMEYFKQEARDINDAIVYKEQIESLDRFLKANFPHYWEEHKPPTIQAIKLLGLVQQAMPQIAKIFQQTLHPIIAVLRSAGIFPEGEIKL